MGDIGLWIGVGLLPNLVCVCVCVCVSYFFFKILIKEYWSLDWGGASSKLGIYIHMFNIYICSCFEKTKCSMYISLWVVFFLENSQKSYIQRLYIMTLYSKYTRALTFENFWGRVHLSMPCMLDIYVYLQIYVPFFKKKNPGDCASVPMPCML